MFCTDMKGVLQTQQGVRVCIRAVMNRSMLFLYTTLTKYYKLFLGLVVVQL